MKAEGSILTEEEREVLLFAATHPNGRHFSNSEIAQRLGMSISKVKILIHQACIKLEAHNRIEALFFAILKGEIRIDELYTLDELAEILSALCPEVFAKIMQLVNKELNYEHIPGMDEQIGHKDRGRDTLLTESEQDVLRLVGRGFSNREIGDKLFMTTSTVRTYIHRACSKLGARSRLDAVILALKRGDIVISEVLSLKELLEHLALLDAESLEEIALLRSQKLEQEPLPAGSLYNYRFSPTFQMKSYPEYLAVS